MNQILNMIFVIVFLCRDLLKELGITIKEWGFVEPCLYKCREIEADSSEAIKEGYPALRAHPKFGNMSSSALWDYLLKPENVADADKYATAFTYMSSMITSEGAYYLADLSGFNSETTETISAKHYTESLAMTNCLSHRSVRPRGGMSAIIHALRHEVDAMGGNIYTNTEVQSITKEDDVYILLTPNLSVRADKLVVATPPGPFRKINGMIAEKIQRTPQFDSSIPIPVFKGAAVYKTPWWENVTIGKTTVIAGQKFVCSGNSHLGVSMAYRQVCLSSVPC